MSLSVINLSKRFATLSVLKGVTFKLVPYQITAILGANGSGKTTLFNIISGFEKADSGEIWLDNVSLNWCSVSTISQKGVGRTFQTPRFFPSLTVLENVLIGLLKFFWRTKEQEAIALEIINFFNLPPEAYPNELTACQKKYLEICRALSTNPKVLLLDEIMAGLKNKESERLTEKILELVKKNALTILMIEHSLEIIRALSDSAIFLHAGKKIANGPLEEIEKTPLFAKVYNG